MDRINIYVSYNGDDVTTQTIVTNWASIVHTLTDIMVWEGGSNNDAQKALLIRSADIIVLISSGRYSKTLERETVACSTAGKACYILAAGDRAAPPEPFLPGVHVFNIWDANAIKTARDLVGEMPCQPQRVHSVLTSLISLLYLE